MKLLCPMLALFLASAAAGLPSPLVGRWNIGNPFDTPVPVGIDAKEERLILGLRLAYSKDHLHVCGKDVPAEALEAKPLSEDEFLQRYGFLPGVIGLAKATIIDLTLDSLNRANPCGFRGVQEAPGVHVFIDSRGHTVMELGNSYFPMKKDEHTSTTRGAHGQDRTKRTFQ